MSKTEDIGLSVIIPIGNFDKDPYRLKSFKYVINKLLHRLVPNEIIVVEQIKPGGSASNLGLDNRVTHLVIEWDGPFYKTLLCNIGVERATQDKVLVMDSDAALHWGRVKEECKRIKLGDFCVPFKVCTRLDEEGTEKIYEGKPITQKHTIGYMTVMGGIAFLVHRADYWSIGGFDERYCHGWGVEDEAIGRIAKLLLRLYKLDCDAYHLYHPRCQKTLMASESQTVHRGIYKSTLYSDRSVPGLAVVATSWGSDPVHIKASKKAIESWFNESAQPVLYVMVEAVKAGEPYNFQYNDRPKYVHIPLVLEDKHDWLFHKESAWRRAFEYITEYHPDLTKTCFIDTHVIPPTNDKLFFAKIAIALDTHDIVQPFTVCTDTEVPNSTRTGLIYSYVKEHTVRGTPGFVYATRNDIHRKLGHFPLIPTCAGDTTAFMRFIPNGFVSDKLSSPPLRRIVKYESPGVKPSLGYLDVAIMHANHGSYAGRLYTEQTALLNFSCSHPNEICQYDNGLLVPTDSPYARAFIKTRSKLIPNMSTKEVRDLWDKEVRTELPPILKPEQLIVACVLRSGGEYTGDHVKWFAEQITNKLDTPHEVVCLSDIDIPGIKTIPLIYNLPTTRSKLEIFRPDIFDPTDTSILLLDLDSVIYRNFTLPMCPEHEIYYVRENERRASWPAWNSSVLYFRPCNELYDVIDRFLTDQISGRNPEWMFPGEQEWSSYTIYHFIRSHQIRDIERLLAVRFWNKDTKPPSDESHIVTWASPGSKPWRVNTNWIPPFTKSI